MSEGTPPWGPGPWIVQDGPRESVIADTYLADGGTIVCDAPNMDASHKYWPARARLITAAPALYDALQACRDAMYADNPADGWAEIIAHADDALRSARGTQP